MEPIVVEFEVACSPEHAFKMWAESAGVWWPRSHTMSQEPGLEVTFEPWVGGRIFEQTSDGSEHDWGEIDVWDPPNRVEYKWHLFFDRSEATDINVTFTATDVGTMVRLRQTGFGRLPSDVGLTRRNRTEGAWAEVTQHFRDAMAASR